MNCKVLALALTGLAAFATASAQSTDQNWEGIWHANVGARPTSTLTLASNTGELGGTLVLDIISGEGGQPHVVASEPHLLLNLHVSANTLTFQVKAMRRDSTKVVQDFEVSLIAPNKATIHCTDCGPGAPVVELVKGL
jgi:hypothetical protein